MLSIVDEQNPPLAAIFGLAGTTLSEEEKDFFCKANPLGFILFAKNCENPEQLKSLTRSLNDLLGREVPILIDQEGGRVQRLKPPHWGTYPAARTFGDMGITGGRQALKSSFTDLSAELASHGINVNCAPVLDLLYPQTDNSIGDRAYSDDGSITAALGAEACRASLSQGVVPIIKHLPGLGRAALDTHHDLPVIDAPLSELDRSDLFPFRQVIKEDFADALWGMVGHAVYKALDPDVPASCSATIIGKVIREAIGFDGLLLSDDLDMGALAVYGTPQARANAALEAGCDIALQCNGKLETMKDMADHIPLMTKAAVARYNRSIQWLQKQHPVE